MGKKYSFALAAAMSLIPALSLAGWSSEKFDAMEKAGLSKSDMEAAASWVGSIGFGGVMLIDADEAKRHPPGLPHAMSMAISGYGKGALCAMKLRPSKMDSSSDSKFVFDVVRLGGKKESAWRLMFRHELAHCVLARMMESPGAPDSFKAEAFADAFAYAASKGQESAVDLSAFVKARGLSTGSHSTSQVLSAAVRSNPIPNKKLACEWAWQASPLDGRSPLEACKAGREASRIVLEGAK